MGVLLAKMAARSKLRILCFGDSLTAGYASMGAVHHPYQEKLEHMLSMAYPDLRVETVEDGLSGSTVKHGFQTRMDEQFAEPEKKRARTESSSKGEGDLVNGKAKNSNPNAYDWVIVLGGTNDIGLGFPPEDVFESLKKVWDVALSAKCKVLALTVPEAGVKGLIRQRMEERREKLNDLIRGYKREGFHVYDLSKTVTYWGMSEADRKKYWADHIYFTPDGYDLIGHKVGMALVSILAKDRALSPQRPQKRRRLFKGDDKKYEEEAGDPSAIDQGYVVVRRHDLD